MDHKELYLALAKCIASVPEEYRKELCRDFRINPRDVEAAASVDNTDLCNFA